jgi:hypothetical protein
MPDPTDQSAVLAQIMDRLQTLEAENERLRGKQKDAEGDIPIDEADDPREKVMKMMINRLAAMDKSKTKEFVVPLNKVYTAKSGRDTLHEDHPPLDGVRDQKILKMPTPFSGEQRDARPFLQRMNELFIQAPHQYRLTRSRIITTCSLLSAGVTASWAQAISEAVTEDIDSVYYTDQWEEFKKGFLKSFGIPNEKEYARNKIEKFAQGEKPFETWLADFKELQRQGEIPDEWALRYFKSNVSLRLLRAVNAMNYPPDTFEDWEDMCRRKELQFMEQQGFNRAHRSEYRAFGKAQPFLRPSPFAQKAKARDPNAMDVDVLRQDRSRPRPPSKQPKTSKPLQKPLPGRSNAMAGSSQSAAVCYLCGRPGHFKRNCPVMDVKVLDQDEKEVLAQYALDILHDNNDEANEETLIDFEGPLDDGSSAPLDEHDVDEAPEDFLTGPA